jgi:hypothetical protein
MLNFAKVVNLSLENKSSTQMFNAAQQEFLQDMTSMMSKILVILTATTKSSRLTEEARYTP